VGSLDALLRRRAESTPELPLYTFLSGDGREERMTLGELSAAADAVAAGLLGQVAPGEHALLLFAPGLDYIAALFGCLRAGVVPVPTYPPLPGRSAAPTRAIAAAADASVALTSVDLFPLVTTAPELAELRGRWRCVSRPGGAASLQVETLGVSAAGAVAERPAASGETAILQYTSGSTARPRGVRLSNANLLTNLEVIRRRFGHDADSVGVIWLPPYHDMGLIGGLLEPLYAGFPVALMSPLDFLRRPWRWLEAISRYRATTSGGPDFAYALAARRVPEDVRASLDLSSWRGAFSGAERVRAGTLARFAETFADVGFDPGAFHPCYGLAEATLYCTGVQGVTVHPDVPELVSCGRVAEGHEVAVVAVDTGRRAGPDEVGEVWLRGPSVASGYHGAHGDERFAGELPGLEGRWLRTGDLGRLRDGELYLVGRLASRLVLRGRTYQAEDVEDVAGAADPALRSGRAVATTRVVDDAEVLVLLHEVVDPADVDAPALAEAIDRALGCELGLTLETLVLLAPRSVLLTSSGKVRRAATVDAWTAGDLPSLAVWPDSTL